MNTIENLNRQFNMELQASHMYMQMSIWCEINNFKGFAKFMLASSEEERGHAQKIKDFAINWITSDKVNPEILNVGNLLAFNADGSIMRIMNEVLAAERAVTESIREIISVAQQESDFATVDFFLPFMKMQIESLAQVNYILDKVALCGDNYAKLPKIIAYQIQKRANRRRKMGEAR
jgi:ferritin